MAKTKPSPKKAPAPLHALPEAAIRAAAAANNMVTFSCSSPACLVTIQVGLLHATFVSTGHMVLPVGTHVLTYQVRGPQGTAFTITAAGATMQPITGTAVDAGANSIT